jgi:hypothetical protein
MPAAWRSDDGDALDLVGELEAELLVEGDAWLTLLLLRIRW